MSVWLKTATGGDQPDILSAGFWYEMFNLASLLNLSLNCNGNS